MTLIWTPTYPADPDVVAYMEAVEAADGQALELDVIKAYDAFILGCKHDGIWDAIKASCILAGARTLSGALVPLAGTAPTNFNFVSGDYNRKTGLVGNGSTKYLNSNRANNADPQDNVHVSAYLSVLGSVNHAIAGGLIAAQTGLYNGASRCRTNSADVYSWTKGFAGVSRSASSSFATRMGNSTSSTSISSSAPDGLNYAILATNTSGGAFSNARIAFYSIGESLDLAKLDSRITDLITAIGAAIP